MVCGSRNSVKVTLALLLICTISSGFLSFDQNNNGKDHLPERQSRRVEDQDHPPPQQPDQPATVINTPPITIIEAANALFSLPNTRLRLLQAAASNYWIKLKALFFKQAQEDHPSSSAPSLDFRRESDQPAETSADAGERVKEAMVKTLDKGKVVIEDSARSAAKFAGDAMDTTTKKAKKILSDTSAPSEAEL